MESQSEREPGGLDMCNNLESMARDGTSCNFNPRGSSTPYSEHGLCRQTESHNGGTIAPQRSTEHAAINSATSQLLTIWLAEINKNACDLMDHMDAHRKAFRSDMQSLQAGIMACACDETRTAGGKMATPRAGANELRGSATAVRPVVEAGEEKLIRGTCWASIVRVTEEVTVTQREGGDGVTETCRAGHV